MFKAVADGRIKALWIMATNPVVSMPDADRVRAAIKAMPVRRRLRHPEGHRHGPPCRCAAARHRLGREGWHGDQFRAPHFPPARRFSTRRARRDPTGGSMAEVAKRMGFADAFSYTALGDLCGTRVPFNLRKRRHRDFDIGAHAETDAGRL
jgi:assimilatory nitrate reductase catalytic subunit